MKKIIFLILISFPLISVSQDFDIYKRITDDKVKIPKIYSSTQLNEFQLLSRNARMMDMAYAMIVPGYLHFKAKEPKKGYYLLGGRVLGYAGLAYSYYRLEDQGERIFGGIKNNKYPENIDIRTYKYIGVASIAVIFFTYFYDWIHGKVMLEKKQEMIRYKYGFKLEMEGSGRVHLQKRTYPSFSVSYSF